MPTIRSSGSSTANGSSPTMWRAHHTAWPRPSGCCWRTATISPKSAREELERVEALARAAQRRLELEADVEIIDQRAFAAAGDEDHLLDPRLARFVDGILDQRPIDDRQHFLGDGLGRGEQARAEARRPGRRPCGWVLHHCGVAGPASSDDGRRVAFRRRRGAAVGRRQVEAIGLARRPTCGPARRRARARPAAAESAIARRSAWRGHQRPDRERLAGRRLERGDLAAGGERKTWRGRGSGASSCHSAGRHAPPRSLRLPGPARFRQPRRATATDASTERTASAASVDARVDGLEFVER